MTAMRKVWEEIWQGHKSFSFMWNKIWYEKIKLWENKKGNSWYRKKGKRKEVRLRIWKLNQFCNSCALHTEVSPTQKMPLISHMTKVVAWLTDPILNFFLSNGTICHWFLLWKHTSEKNSSLKLTFLFFKKMSHEEIESNLHKPCLRKKP